MALALSNCAPDRARMAFLALANARGSALPDDAERAVNEQQGKLWRGRKLKVDVANARAPLKARVGRLASEALPSRPAAVPTARGAKRPASAAVSDVPAKRTCSAQQPSASRPALAVRALLSPAYARTVALGGLVLPCQQGVTAQAVAAYLTSAGIPCKSVMPCLPEHLLSLQQDGCTGEVGLLEFESSDEAQRVVSMLHKRTSLAGCEGICLWARQLGGEGAQVRRWRLIIRNVAFSASEQVLRRLFSTAGFVWDLHIPIGENGSMRGFAFVAYTARARELRAVSTVHLCVLIRPSQTPSEQLKC